MVSCMVRGLLRRCLAISLVARVSKYDLSLRGAFMSSLLRGMPAGNQCGGMKGSMKTRRLPCYAATRIAAISLRHGLRVRATCKAEASRVSASGSAWRAA
ncbi:hypothetical protein D3C87_1288740 [compost metagenome]